MDNQNGFPGLGNETLEAGHELIRISKKFLCIKLVSDIRECCFYILPADGAKALYSDNEFFLVLGLALCL